MLCCVCKKPFQALTHSHCRAHAFCGLEHGSRYHSAPCVVCRDIWEAAEDISNEPDTAVSSFKNLEEWISGFRRNSRHRRPGVDHFYDSNERRRYEVLFARHARHTAALSRSVSAPDDSPSVS